MARFQPVRIDDVVAYSHGCRLHDKQALLLQAVAASRAKKVPLDTAARLEVGNMYEPISFRMIRDGIAWHVRMLPVRWRTLRIMLRLWRRMPAGDRVMLDIAWHEIAPRLLSWTKTVIAGELADHLKKTTALVELANAEDLHMPPEER